VSNAMQCIFCECTLWSQKYLCVLFEFLNRFPPYADEFIASPRKVVSVFR
uniref:Biogenesis of lysosome-related organelles complex 1 subunit 1 n=1 Tax=Parascaris univalens TaxID=6257 RepID=A0A915CCP3_PARUN